MDIIIFIGNKFNELDVVHLVQAFEVNRTIFHHLYFSENLYYAN